MPRHEPRNHFVLSTITYLRLCLGTTRTGRHAPRHRLSKHGEAPEPYHSEQIKSSDRPSSSAQRLAFSREVLSAAKASSGATTEFGGVDRVLVSPRLRQRTLANGTTHALLVILLTS